jgi:hypothetical protein
MNASEAYDLYSPYQYAWMTMNYFLSIWFTSLLIHVLLCREGDQGDQKDAFKQLEECKKRNVVTYIILFFGTIFALFAQVYGGTDILFHGKDTTTPDRIEWILLSVISIMVLYVWELIYRLTIGLPLLIHHICTIILIQLVTASFYDTHRVMFLRFALLLGFHATTEQLSFVALFCFRLNIFHKYQHLLFYVASGQAFLVKSIVTVYSVYYYSVVVHRDEFGDTWNNFWKIAFIPFLLLLFAAQVYACRILLLLGQRCHRDESSVADDEQVRHEETNDGDFMELGSTSQKSNESISGG